MEFDGRGGSPRRAELPRRGGDPQKSRRAFGGRSFVELGSGGHGPRKRLRRSAGRPVRSDRLGCHRAGGSGPDRKGLRKRDGPRFPAGAAHAAFPGFPRRADRSTLPPHEPGPPPGQGRRHPPAEETERPPGRRSDSPDATYLVTGGLAGWDSSPRRGWWSGAPANSSSSGAGAGRRSGHGDPQNGIRRSARALRVRGRVGCRTDAGAPSGAVDGAPPLRGIIHSAGVSTTACCCSRTGSGSGGCSPRRSRAPGSCTEATLGAPLDFFVLYSSVASLFGSGGSIQPRRGQRLPRFAGLGTPGPGSSLGQHQLGRLGGGRGGRRRGVGERADDTGIGGIPPAEGWRSSDAC